MISWRSIPSFPWLEYSEAGGVCRCGQEDDGGDGGDGPGRLVRQSPHVVVDVLPECGDVAVLSSNGRLQRERATSITSHSLTSPSAANGKDARA